MVVKTINRPRGDEHWTRKVKREMEQMTKFLEVQGLSELFDEFKTISSDEAVALKPASQQGDKGTVGSQNFSPADEEVNDLDHGDDDKDEDDDDDGGNHMNLSLMASSTTTSTFT